jgi:hypothetical protein
VTPQSGFEAVFGASAVPNGARGEEHLWNFGPELPKVKLLPD